MTERPRNIANDILDAVETATSKWTRQKKSEERHPGMVRYRASRMTKEPRTSQKEAAWEILEAAYMAASGNNTLPALARQIFYQARPKIMAMTDDKELAYLGTLHRDTRRYQFSNPIEPIDLGLRLEDIAGLEREPAAATKINELDLDNDRAGLLDVIKRRRGKALRASDNALSAILKDWGFTKKALAEGTGWVAPSLPELRDKICLKYPAVEWDDSVTEWGKPAAEAN